MTDYTIISNSRHRHTASVIAEYDVPGTGTNAASIQWRTIVADLRAFNGQTGQTNNPVKKDNAAYVGQLDAGEKVELTLSVEYDAASTNAEKVAVIDAAVTARIAGYVNEFQNRYEFYGTERTV